MKPNIFGQEIYMSQKHKSYYRNDCPIFSTMANLAYNTGITGYYDDEEDADKLVKALGLHTDENWGYANTFEHIIDDVHKRYIDTWKIKTPDFEWKKFSKNKTTIRRYLDLWYAIRVWISVNRDFLLDAQDNWKVDLYKDFSMYAGTNLKHFFNITKGTFNNPMKGKEFVIDNYFGTFKHNKYEVDIDELFKVMYTTCYLTLPIY